MTAKKISEFPIATTFGTDFLPVVTGMEPGGAPVTERIHREALKMSPGGYNAFLGIMALNPVYYWPCDYAPTNAVEVVTGQNATPVQLSNRSAYTQPVRMLSVFAPRILTPSPGSANTEISWTGGDNWSIHVVYHRPGTANTASIIAGGFNQKWRIETSRSDSTGVTRVVMNFAVGGLQINGPSGSGSGAGAFKFYVRSVLWTFSSTTGHTLYINGTSVATSTSTTLMATPTQNILLDGVGDEVRYQDLAIFDSTLSATDAANLAALFGETRTVE